MNLTLGDSLSLQEGSVNNSYNLCQGTFLRSFKLMIKMGMLLIKMIKEKKQGNRLAKTFSNGIRHSLLLGHWFQFSLNQKKLKTVIM